MPALDRFVCHSSELNSMCFFLYLESNSCHVRNRYRLSSFVGRRVEALGWGTIEYGGPVSSRLLKVQLDVVNQSRCEATYPQSFTSAQLCTFSRNKDTCSYDSGGPLMFSDSTGNSLLYQIGITSYGIHCASTTPSVSTKVMAYLDWIEKVTPLANYCVQ